MCLNNQHCSTLHPLPSKPIDPESSVTVDGTCELCDRQLEERTGKGGSRNGECGIGNWRREQEREKQWRVWDREHTPYTHIYIHCMNLCTYINMHATHIMHTCQHMHTEYAHTTHTPTSTDSSSLLQ